MIEVDSSHRIFREAPVKLFFSENACSLKWPWRMAGAQHAQERMVESSEYYILDSAFQRDDIGIEEVLDTGVELGADMIALVDEYGSSAKTVENVLNDMEAVDDHEWDGDVLVPLQPPHGKCYRELEGIGDWYGVGGVARSSPEEKIHAAHEIRDAAGPEIHLHGLGWGVTLPVVRAIRDDPDLLDSLDSKGEYDRAMTEDMPETWQSRDSVPSGRGLAVVSHAAGYLIEGLRRMNPEITVDPAEDMSDPASEVDW